MAQRASEGTGLESFFLVPALLLKAPGCPAEQMLLGGTACETALKGARDGPAVLRCRDWIIPTTLPPWKDEKGFMLGM